jgi:DnaJ-class molecular chaperone
MNVTNAYKILEIDPHASDEVVRAAYRSLAQKYHPDKVTGDPVKMKEINTAYEILSDPVKRTAYDFTLDMEMHEEEKNNQANTEPVREETTGVIANELAAWNAVFTTIKFLIIRSFIIGFLWLTCLWVYHKFISHVVFK